MSYRHHYKQRDYRFAHLLMSLRRRADLTQDEVALKVGVAPKSIRNWEGGLNYPTDAHLQHLIELYLDAEVFEAGKELEEVRDLWEQFRESAHRSRSLFNELWFAALLTRAYTRKQGSSGEMEPGAPASDQKTSGLLPPAESVTESTARASALPHQEDWGEALDVSSFAGREPELAMLERWVLSERCRLVLLLGMGGIGKTALVTTFAQRVAAQFEVVIWRSLHLGPRLDQILSDCLHLLLDQRAESVPQDLNERIFRLLACLREKRCLLVLDNVEALFQGGERAGSYHPGYEDYRTLFLRVGGSTHQSCLLVTSREMLSELDLLRGTRAPLPVLKMGGLSWQESRAILEDEALFAEPQVWQDLSERYTGNPLALKVVAGVVRELFGGDVAAFLRQGSVTFHGIRTLLKEQVERLSLLEQELVYWLAVERDLTSLEHLRAMMIQQIPVEEVLEGFSSLWRRNLIERGGRGAVFLLQPVILEYVTDRLVEQVAQEILTFRPDLLLRYALLQAQAQDYVRRSQGELILQAVLDRLQLHLRARQKIEERLDQLLKQLRTLPLADQGYGGGNVVNLLVRLNGHLRGKNCSHLLIQQANLQGVEAQDTHFEGASLRNCVFLEIMNGIASVALSPNGHYLAGSSTNGEIRVWRVADGQPLLALEGHAWLASAIAFDPESTLLASGGYDNLVKVWEVESGQCLSILQGHSKWIRAVAFHPAGRLLATCSHDGSIRLWDITTSRCIKVWYEQRPEILSVAFSPDGKLLASGDITGVVKLWDLESEQCLWTIAAHAGSPTSSLPSVASLAFSPDGEVLVSGGEDGKLRVWEASSGKHLSTLSGHMEVVFSVCFQASGVLASASFDGTAKLWQIRREREASYCLGTLQDHGHWLWSVTSGPEGLLATGSHDGVITLWQVNSESGGKCLRTLRGYSCQITTVALSPDGKLLVSGENNGAVRVWEARSGKPLRVLSRQPGESIAQALSPDGQFFASPSKSTADNVIQIWEVDSERCVKTLKGSQGLIWSMAFSPDGRLLLSGADKTITCWEVSSGVCLATFEGHRSWVWSLACSPDGKLLASGDMTGVVKIWQISSGQCLHTLHGSSRAIVALAFTPDAQTLLSSNEQDLVTRWDVKTGERLKLLPGVGDTYWPNTVAFSAGGSFLAVASTDRTVKVWDVSNGDLLHTFESYTGRPRSVAWSADQHLLACGTDTGTILLWERQTGTCLMTLCCDRPYERMNMSDVTGLTEAQRATLKALGAIEKEVGEEAP